MMGPSLAWAIPISSLATVTEWSNGDETTSLSASVSGRTEGAGWLEEEALIVEDGGEAGWVLAAGVAVERAGGGGRGRGRGGGVTEELGTKGRGMCLILAAGEGWSPCCLWLSGMGPGSTCWLSRSVLKLRRGSFDTDNGS